MSLGVAGSETSMGRGRVGLSSRPTCMIVEDQALIGLALEAYLEEVGFSACETLPSEAEALDWLVMNTPSAAILDYRLKDGPCTRLVRALRERSVPFVIYSGHTRDRTVPELEDVPWVCKPCDRAALLAALTRICPVLAEKITSVAA